MIRLCCYSLIDITNTGITSFSRELELERNQQRNWETIQQVVSLRDRVKDIEYLGCEEVDIDSYYFGVNYSGKQRVWKFAFSTDDNVYTVNADNFGKLKQDTRITPVLLGLTETIKARDPFFFVDGVDRNVYFTKLQ